ncbi:hypothetical protein OCS_05334 [Ophiocordyceps sinensis CO18]|uniref:Uncharacterized protein n=1 Tax=Ophiocordyceps sinensis (strain Co18 / CGMCC 3.14243) TaxID=911162 RepID=T5AB20_OPHSC|nr:hypothetical protein OCS_05334 [Ophiocordyceps sinensis CO18]
MAKTGRSPRARTTRPEQMRNAAVLTKKWNSTMDEELGLSKGVTKGRARPEVMDEEGSGEAIEWTRAKSIFEYVLATLRTRRSTSGDVEVEDGAIYAPYSRGIVLTEEGMQRSQSQETAYFVGRGTWPINSPMRFLDV